MAFLLRTLLPVLGLVHLVGSGHAPPARAPGAGTSCNPRENPRTHFRAIPATFPYSPAQLHDVQAASVPPVCMLRLRGGIAPTPMMPALKVDLSQARKRTARSKGKWTGSRSGDLDEDSDDDEEESGNEFDKMLKEDVDDEPLSGDVEEIANLSFEQWQERIQVCPLQKAGASQRLSVHFPWEGAAHPRGNRWSCRAGAWREGASMRRDSPMQLQDFHTNAERRNFVLSAQGSKRLAGSRW